MARRLAHRFVIAGLLAKMVLGLGGVTLAAAPESASVANKIATLDTSLRLVPESAAFYSALLRGREQVQIVAASRAWKKLTELPVVQMGKALYQMQAAAPESPVAKFEQALKDPQVREALNLLGDMFSHEVFVYGDASSLDFVELLQQIQGGSQLAQILSQLQGSEQEQSKTQAKMILELLSENIDRLKVPSIVLGFRVQNTQRAVEQLAKLELILGVALQMDPKTKEALKRTKIAGHEYLVVTLTGQMIPWDQIPLDEVKNKVDTPAQIDKVVAQLKKQKLVITIGLRGNYLIAAVGPSTDAVSALGQGRRLVDRPEWKRLDPHVAKRITGLGYMSQQTAQRLLSNQSNLKPINDAADELLPLAHLSPEQEKRIQKDLKALIEDLQHFLPKLGPAVSVELLVPEGRESFAYHWAENLGSESPRPLGLLSHLGGSPLVAAVARAELSRSEYDVLTKWLRVAWGYFEELGLPRIEKKEQAELKKFIDRVRPLVRRIDEVNRTMLIPSLGERQVGLLFDAKLQSKQFLRDLPATEKPMPMIEPAVVAGVSDPALLRKAAGEYVKFLQGVLKAAHDVTPSEVPVLQVPSPKISKTAQGELASYALPEQWGLDKQMAPTFGLSDSVAVVAGSPKHADRLLKSTPLKTGGVLADLQRPRVGAIVLQWAGLVDLLAPWIDLGLRQVPPEQQPMIIPQVHTAIEILKVFRSTTFEQSREGNLLVQHLRTDIRDLAEKK